MAKYFLLILTLAAAGGCLIGLSKIASPKAEWTLICQGGQPIPEVKLLDEKDGIYTVRISQNGKDQEAKVPSASCILMRDI